AGRVGDVPQVGSGFFATPAGGASATGAGEDIVRVTLTREAVRQLESGVSPQTAADRALAEFDEVTGSTAGLIVLDSEGRAGSAYNSAAMQTSSTES
ncbi:isoaspartyl peptidase/L-asparaginase, partial [Halococcus hamelinensis]